MKVIAVLGGLFFLTLSAVALAEQERDIGFVSDLRGKLTPEIGVIDGISQDHTLVTLMYVNAKMTCYYKVKGQLPRVDLASALRSIDPKRIELVNCGK